MTGQTTMASVKVDGNKLAEAIRRVTSFMGDGSRPTLACVYAESQGGVLQLTATDGYRMTHLSVPLPFPEGQLVILGVLTGSSAWWVATSPPHTVAGCSAIAYLAD
ncbi:unnamed protein product, partial [marine sediment metagenome]